MDDIVEILSRPVQSILNRFGYRVQRVDSVCFFETLLHRCMRRTPELFFIEIGANDGISFDPIYPFIVRNRDRVRGIVIEPMKDAFAALTRTYANFPKVLKVNAAIHPDAKEMDLHRVDTTKGALGLPRWTKGIASFNPDHHKLSDTPTEHMTVERVRCMSFDELLTKFDVTRVDLLQIDTEGYDYEILRRIDWARLRPAIVRFEHGLSCGIMSKAHLKELIDLFYQNDYSLVMERNDAIAYQHDLWDSPRSRMPDLAALSCEGLR